MRTRRGLFYAAGAMLVITPPALWFVSSFDTHLASTVSAPAAAPAEPARALTADKAELAALAERDPMDLVRRGIERYDREVRAYRCVFIKQELLPDGISEVQEIEVRYRESPRTVYMLWLKNADQARRALYADSPEYVDKNGQKVARVEPAGAIARLFVSDVKVLVDGAEAKKSSRRGIDEFGFRAAYDLLMKYNTLAAERGVLDLKYGGTGEIDGRPTFKLIRNLPYVGPAGAYPDARMVLHIDQEWLLPVAIYSYADAAERELLGSYVYTKVELNPPFTEADFTF